MVSRKYKKSRLSFVWFFDFKKNDKKTVNDPFVFSLTVDQDYAFLDFQHNKENWIDEIYKDDLPDNYDENRKIGENESYIYKMIRDDNVIVFITYDNRNNISLNSMIQASIYETNSLWLKKQSEYNNYISCIKKNNDYVVSLIKYAAFFGSIQIFQYLRMN